MNPVEDSLAFSTIILEEYKSIETIQEHQQITQNRHNKEVN